LTQLLRLEEAAKILNVTYFRACELVRRDILPAVKLGRQVRIDPGRLQHFIENGGKSLPGGWRRKVEAEAP